MASRRILTRTKKEAIRNDGVHVIYGKNTVIHQAQPCDGENSLVNKSTSLNKSYPQPNEASTRKFTKRKASETDNPCKQRHALREQFVNVQKQPGDPKNEHPLKYQADDACSSAKMEESPCLFETPSTDIMTPDAEDITQEEMSVLDEQMTMDAESMDCNTGLTPYLKEKCLDQNESLPEASSKVDPLREMLQRRAADRPVKLPRGVHNIDAFPDCLHTTIYSQDIMNYLKIKERHYRIPATFMDTSRELTSRMRGVLMDWLLRVQTHEELQEGSLHMAVTLIDRYLAISGVQLVQLQLLGITSLLISSKFLERFAPEISTLCYLTSNTFKADEVRDFERRMLMLLHFDLAFPVCTTFLDRYLQVHEDAQPIEVDYLAHYILNLSTTRVSLAIVLPSELAASALYLSRRLVIGINEAWTPALAYYTMFSSLADLSDIIHELAQLLLKAPTAKFQGARAKYNTKEYGFVSHSNMVSPEIVESHFTSPTESSV